MKKSVRNALWVLAGVPLVFLVCIAAALTLGTDRSPLPTRSALFAHIDSQPSDFDGLPLWRETFHDQHGHIDYKIELMLSQHRKWDAEIVRHEVEKSADLLSAIHDLRKLQEIHSNYISESNGYELYMVEKAAGLVIAVGLLDWHDGRHIEASERFRDAAHLARLLYNDDQTTMASQRSARQIVLTLVTSLQRPIANSSTQDEIVLLEQVSAELPETNRENQLAAIRNEKAAFLVSLIDQVELPFFRRINIANDIYHWSSEYCAQSGVAEEPYCRDRFYNFLSLVFPRFYTHWQPLDAYLEANYEYASQLLGLPCSKLPINSSIETPSPHWSDYFTPNSSLARMNHNNEAYRRLIVDQCLTEFFVSSQKVAAALKAYELEAGEVADSLDAAMRDIPKDPFGTDSIHYDVVEQLLWSVGIDGDADKGYPGAPAPLSYSSTSIMSSHPTYLLNPGPIPEPEERKSRCKKDPDIAPLEPLEEQTEDEQAEAI